MKHSPTDQLLAQVPLFAGLSKRELNEISNLGVRITVRAGRELTRQGARGQEFIVVLDGSVDVLVDDVVVASPEAGQCYGEIALLEDRPRTATVMARTDVTVDIIGRREFVEMLERQPQIKARLQEAMAEHLAADGARPADSGSDPN